MPENFWAKVQSQNKVRQLTEAVKKSLSEAQLEGYGANPILGAQRVEGRLGQLFGKGKSITRDNILEFEKTMSSQLAELKALTGKSVEELVANGIITQEAASAMLDPQIMNMALGHAVSATSPQVLRALSAIGGSVGAAFGVGVNPLAAGALGVTLAIPRTQGELALAIGRMKRAGGLGTGIAGTRGAEALSQGVTTANQLRALLQKR